VTGAVRWTPTGLGFSGPPPVTPQKKLAYAASGKTDGVIITELLTLAGLTNIDSPLPEKGLVLGNLQPVALPVGQAPASLIKRIDDLTWMDTIERADGIITRIPRSIRPSAQASRTFTQGVEIYNLKRTRNTEGAYANVIVTGISGVGNDGVSTYTVEFESENVVPDANGLEDTYTYSEDMIETEAIAEEWGTIFLGEFGQIQHSYELELLSGDSTLHSGMTISIVSSKYALTSSSRFLVQTVRHVAQGQGFITYLTVKGSAVPTGSDANQGPIINLKILYDLEYLGGVKNIIAIFDARESYDPDAFEGAANNGIVTWVWDGDPVVPIPSSNGQQAIALYPGETVYGATVSLTLGDDHGKFTTKTVTLNPNPKKDLFLRDLWAATPGSGVIFSNNGARSWQEMGVPDGKGVCEIAAKEYNLAWDGAGELWRIVATMSSGVAVNSLSGQNVTAASITIDSDGNETGKCWAGTNDGNVWLSLSEGLITTWTKISTPTTKLPGKITYISESPYALGSLQATTGRGFYISFDNGVTWIKIFEHPNAGALATHFVGGFIPLTPTTGESKGFVSFDGARTSGQPHFVMERPDDDHVSAFAFPAGDLEVQIEAMTLEVDGSFLYAVGADHLGAGGAWEVRPDADGAFTRKTWNNARSGKAWHTIRDPRLIKIAYFAAENEVGKAFGGFVSTAQLRAGKAWKVGIGDLHLPPPAKGNLVWSAWNRTTLSSACIMALTEDGFERRADPHPCAGMGTLPANTTYPLASSGDVLFTWARNGLLANYQGSQAGNAFRSLDGGNTWTVLPFDYVAHIVPAGDDTTIYASSANGPLGPSQLYHLHRSDDNGATWTLLSTWTAGGAQYSTLASLTVSGADPQQFTFHGHFDPGNGIGSMASGHFIAASNDGGATYINSGIIDADEAGNDDGSRHAQSRGGALLHYDNQPGGSPLLRSIIGGATRVVVRPTENPHWFSHDALSDYIYGGDGVFVSSDDGLTWEAIYDGPRNAIVGGDHDTDPNVIAFVPGDLTNDWYVAPNINPVKLGRRLAASSPSLPWEDITGALNAAFPDGETWPMIEGMARVEEPA
jgi:hypothetical protein